MNQMQQMLARAQKMQRELAKAEAELAAKEFVVEKNGMVKVTVLGDRTVKSIEIDKDALDPENKEMLEEALSLAMNEAMAKIAKEREEIEERITGQSGGFGF
jgi:DNA-binding YbaB/EbfC family protein